VGFFLIELDENPHSRQAMVRIEAVATKTLPVECPEPPKAESSFPALSATEQSRLAEMLRLHLPCVWRAGRRAGLTNAQAEENAQEVFAVAARKLDEIQPGRERAFLLGVALRLANNTRRLVATQVEMAKTEPRKQWTDSQPAAEELLSLKQQREVLDAILMSMSDSFREALTLYEIQDLTLPEIADVLSIPLGTATSRLRRAREEFARKAERYVKSTARRKDGA
jgi:RNA polymerase sigma-70 factor (ECF subfamily)